MSVKNLTRMKLKMSGDVIPFLRDASVVVDLDLTEETIDEDIFPSSTATEIHKDNFTLKHTDTSTTQYSHCILMNIS